MYLTRRPAHYNELLILNITFQSYIIVLCVFPQGSSQRIRLFSIKNIQHPVTGELLIERIFFFGLTREENVINVPINSGSVRPISRVGL